MKYILPLLAILLLTGCQTLSDAQVQGIHNNAQASANAAASLPKSAQTAGIIDSQKAIATAVGLPLTSTTSTTVTP